jgi:hypothetical protein
MSFVKSTDGSDDQAEEANGSSEVERPENAKGFLDLKATFDSMIYSSVVECIRHHQQTLQ